MNILMVLSTRKYPPERRVEREALALVRAGHNVYLMARRGPGQAKEETVKGVHVIRVPLPFQKYKAVADTIYYLFQRYFIFFWIFAACRRHSIQALHVHNIPYGLASAWAGKLLKIPVILDMHEYYVEILKDSLKAKKYQWYRPFSAVPLWLLSREEKFVCRHANKIVLIVPEQGERLLDLGSKEEQFVIVSNTEDPDYFCSISVEDSIEKRFKQSNQYLLVYVGGFNLFRGLDTAIKAMPTVLASIPNARLLLAGDGENRKELEQLTQELKLNDFVIFTGYVPFEHVPTYIRISDVCLLPLYLTSHVNTTVANKLFQYMLLSKPVIVSNARPMMRILDETQCGLLFEEKNSQSLAKAIIQLYDPQKREELGKNGYNAAMNQYHWKHSENALLDIYSHLEKLSTS